MLTDQQFLLIHQAIHTWVNTDKPRRIRINGNTYPLEVSPRAKCRMVQIGDIKFIEQNQETNTRWARAAIDGSKITWAIPLSTRGVTWGRIVNGVIEEPIQEAG